MTPSSATRLTAAGLRLPTPVAPPSNLGAMPQTGAAAAASSSTAQCSASERDIPRQAKSKDAAGQQHQCEEAQYSARHREMFRRIADGDNPAWLQSILDEGSHAAVPHGDKHTLLDDSDRAAMKRAKFKEAAHRHLAKTQAERSTIEASSKARQETALRALGVDKQEAIRAILEMADRLAQVSKEEYRIRGIQEASHIQEVAQSLVQHLAGSSNSLDDEAETDAVIALPHLARRVLSQKGPESKKSSTAHKRLVSKSSSQKTGRALHSAQAGPSRERDYLINSAEEHRMSQADARNAAGSSKKRKSDAGRSKDDTGPPKAQRSSGATQSANVRARTLLTPAARSSTPATLQRIKLPPSEPGGKQRWVERPQMEVRSKTIASSSLSSASTPSSVASGSRPRQSNAKEVASSKGKSKVSATASRDAVERNHTGESPTQHSNAKSVRAVPNNSAVSRSMAIQSSSPHQCPHPKEFRTATTSKVKVEVNSEVPAATLWEAIEISDDDEPMQHASTATPRASLEHDMASASSCEQKAPPSTSQPCQDPTHDGQLVRVKLEDTAAESTVEMDVCVDDQSRQHSIPETTHASAEHDTAPASTSKQQSTPPEPLPHPGPTPEAEAIKVKSEVTNAELSDSVDVCDDDQPEQQPASASARVVSGLVAASTSTSKQSETIGTAPAAGPSTSAQISSISEQERRALMDLMKSIMGSEEHKDDYGNIEGLKSMSRMSI